MRRKNLLLSAFLILTLCVISAKESFSQWTIAGTVSNVGTSPSISVVDQNTAWITGTVTPSIYRTTNGGTTWTTIPTTGISFEGYCIWAKSATECYVGDGGASGGAGGNAKLYKTTDAGTTWTVVSSTGGSAGFFNGVVFSRSTPNFGVAESDPPNGVGQPYFFSITNDGGVTWNTLTPNPPGVAGQASAQNALFVVNNQFYGIGLGNTAPARAIITRNGGTSWSTVTLGSLVGGFVSGLAFKDANVGISAASASLPNISRTTDGGVTWTTFSIGAGSPAGYCSMKFIEGTNTCYLAGATGAAGAVSKSTNGGLNWTTMTTSGITGITNFDFVRVGTTVYGYAVTTSGAVIKMSETVTGIESNAVNSVIPIDYKLEQNYPNPFNPTTNINFSLPKSSNVTLKVYDALGKEVATLVDEFRTAGNYTSEFNATSNLTSGIYFYTLTSENFTSTKKLMLVK